MNLNSIIDHMRGAGLVSVLIVLPILQIASVRIAPVLIAFAVFICMVASLLARENPFQLNAKLLPKQPNNKLLFGATAILILWSILSLLWGLDPSRGAYRIVIVCAGICSAWYLGVQFSKIPFERLPIVYLLGGATTIAALFVGLEFTTTIQELTDVDYQRYDYNRVAVTLSLFVWPLLVFIKRSRAYFAWGTLILIGLCISIFSSESETAKLSFLIGSVSAAIAALNPQLRKFVSLGMATVVLAFPFCISLLENILPYFPSSFLRDGHAVHRLQIWKGAADLAKEHWLVGWGMKSDRLLGNSGAMGKYAQEAGYSAEIIAPHNLALELWINIGLTGMLPLAVILFSLGLVSASSKIEAAALLGFQATIFTMLMSGAGSTGLQGWLVSALAIVTASFIAIRNLQARTRVSVERSNI